MCDQFAPVAERIKCRCQGIRRFFASLGKQPQKSQQYFLGWVGDIEQVLKTDQEEADRRLSNLLRTLRKNGILTEENFAEFIECQKESE